MTRSRIFSILALTGVLSACGFMRNSTDYDPVALTNYTPTVTPKILWETDIGSGSAYGISPAISGQFIYAATPSGHLSKVDLRSGQKSWQVRTSEKITGGVASDAQFVAVMTQDAKLHVFDAQTGTEKWQAQMTTIASSTPAIAQGVLVVKSDDFRVQAYDLKTGRLLWVYARTQPSFTVQRNSGILIHNGVAIVGLASGRLVALDLHNGQLKWEKLVAPTLGATELALTASVSGTPVQSAQTLCTAAYESELQCLNLAAHKADGPAQTWHYTWSSVVSPLLEGKQLYAVDDHGTVALFDITKKDQQTWLNVSLRNRGLTNPVHYQNSILVGDYQGYVHFLNAQSGELQARVSLGGGAVYANLQRTPYGVLVQNGSGKLYMIGK